jgi:hypothetical protein
MNEMEAKLVEALRSGRYQQTMNCLKSVDNKFCCLGVACDISGIGEWDNQLYLDRFSFLPLKVRDAYGWLFNDGLLMFTDRDDESIALSTLNDLGFTFNQIADIIQAGLVRHE